MFVTVRWNAVNFVVRSHDALYVSFFDGRLEWLEKIFADHPLGIITRRHIGATFRLAVYCEMFGGGDDMRLINKGPGSLKPLNGSYPDTRSKIRVFAIGFFSASPARIARQIKHRSQTLLCTARPNFSGRRGKNVMNQGWIPGGCHRDGLRI